ncbi:MAG: FtsW/RodA/SpoVE family cell cycle protein [Chloroflexi bacterium]|nr:FtsW/RodA/SpoVE family cell cycle protein [Chloroflexota bacterium]
MSRILTARPTGRFSELYLLMWAGPLAAAGLATLSSVRSGQVQQAALQPAIVLLVVLLGLHFWLSFIGSRADQLLLPVAGGLAALGLVIVGRLDPDSLWKQTAWVGLGVGAAVVLVSALSEPSWLKRYKYTWAVLGVVIAGLTLVLGRDPHGGGASLWVRLGPAMFQPGEILKVLLAVFLAGYLDDKRELLSAASLRVGPLKLPPLPYLAPLAIMWGLTLLLLAVEKDLGLALLLFGLFLAMLYVASSRLVYVWSGLAAFGVGAYVIYRFFYYVQTRVHGWLDPWYDPTGGSYQIVQALLAIGSGRVLGTGLGQGMPTLIPAAVTDFPFAAIAEELGLAGCLAVVALYLILIYRGYRIALAAFDPFQQLLATGLTTVLALQVFVIVGGNIKLIPLTGITLPFISYGGSSLLTNFAIVGILLAISDRSARVET